MFSTHAVQRFFGVVVALLIGIASAGAQAVSYTHLTLPTKA